MRVIYNELHPQYDAAIEWFRREVNREADDADLCGFVAMCAMELKGNRMEHIGFIHQIAHIDPMPTDDRSAFVVVFPTVDIFLEEQ